MNKDLARILASNRDQFIERWSQAIIESAGPNFQRLTSAEVTALMARCFDAFVTHLQTGAADHISEWSRSLPFKRDTAAFGRKAGFDIDEIQRAVYLFEKVALELADEEQLRRRDQLEMAGAISETLQTAILDISRKYLVVMEKRLLGRHFSPEMLDRIIDQHESIFHAKSAKLTMFFSDIRGFTRISQQLDREEMIEILNTYFARMTQIVFEHGGVLDKFIGDAVMVFFGEPEPLSVEEQALRAIRMSLRMMAEVETLKSTVWAGYGETPVAIGIGINTGFVTVGHVGSKERMEYTVLGSNVNLAARLEHSAQPGQILVTRRTLEPIKDLVDYEELGSMSFKNVAEPVAVFNVKGLKQ